MPSYNELMQEARLPKRFEYKGEEQSGSMRIKQLSENSNHIAIDSSSYFTRNELFQVACLLLKFYFQLSNEERPLNETIESEEDNEDIF